jgi:biopolymer transport protein ExbD
MSVSVDTGGGKGGRKNVDVDINLVPFIDMMSCLTAFLLITAVWTNLAQIDIKPKGIGKSSAPPSGEPPVTIAILVSVDSQWIGLSTGDRRQIKKTGDAYDWEGLRVMVREFRGNPLLADRTDIEVAAEDGVMYQDIVTTMEIAIDDRKGFPDVGFVHPSSLSVQFGM